MNTPINTPRWRRRDWVRLASGAGLGLLLSRPTLANDFWRLAQVGGHVFLMRHARTEPGIGDPPGFQLGNCRTQRNLSDVGRADATALGQRFRAEGVALDRVLSSAWCRCTDTAALAFDPHYPRHEVWPALNSFFQGQGDGARQTAAVMERLLSVQAPTNWMLVTHQVNITALTGEVPAMGEVFLVKPPKPGEQRLAVRARWQPTRTG